jgi:predicted ABC-type ATPase
MPTLYIIAGCNGAGKTTASNTILPEVLNCKEFVNADNIAAGLSPFDVEKYAVEAGRLMLKRIDQLMAEKVDFAIETTLSSKTYRATIKEAQKNGYNIFLCFFWLSSVRLATQRVRKRVAMGGHNIPAATIKRRYYRGLINFIKIYSGLADAWVVYDNSRETSTLVASGEKDVSSNILDFQRWKRILNQCQKRTT